ncbi:MAG: hypothetical protein AAFV07_03535 [Bacteroidota bacterium]
MRFTYICLSLLLTGSLHMAFGQSLVDQVVIELQHGIFDPAKGLGLKADHFWRQGEKATLQSSLALHGSVRPNVSPFTTGEQSEFFGHWRLQAHTGYSRRLGKKANWHGVLELYAGLRGYYVSGTLDQANQDFDRSFQKSTVRGDIGFRMAIGRKLTDRLDLQLSANTSLIEVNNPLGFYTGLYYWGPDALGLVGLGVRYRLGA